MSSYKTTPTKTSKAFWFFICIAILCLGFGSFTLLKALKPEPEQRPQVNLTPQVSTMALHYRNTPLLVEGSGIVAPKSEISLASQVSGEVISIHPNLVTGGSFNAGEVILEIDSRTFTANLAEAEANKSANISSLTFINKQIARLRSLRKDGYTPEESLDDAISRRDQTLAAIARQDALIEIRQLDLERTTIKAPFSGLIISENVDIGDIVSTGQELARFYDTAEVEIVVSLNSQDAGFIPGLWSNRNNAASKQRKAWVNVNHGGRVYQWPGYLDRVEAGIDPNTRTVDVVVRIPSPSSPGEIQSNSTSINIDAPPLLVGMYGTVSIEGMSLAKHFVVPINTIHGSNIWITNSEGKLTIAPVEIVREEGNQAVILAPQLSPGTLMVTSNIALVSDGMSVLLQDTLPATLPPAPTGNID